MKNNITDYILLYVSTMQCNFVYVNLTIQYRLVQNAWQCSFPGRISRIFACAIGGKIKVKVDIVQYYSDLV